ncbi:MAG: hypothetical protein J7497_07900 [Chitinophagaceae bacterium]|nr:hypothetical protein [Chitinophagaceae bacterium]
MLEKYFPDNFSLETPRIVLSLKESSLKQPTPAPTGATPPKEGMGDSRVMFNITDNYTKTICGTAEYFISFENKSAEMNWEWNDPDDADQGLIKNLKFAMLSYGFQVMKMEKMIMNGDGSKVITAEEWPRTKEVFFPELM